MLKSSMHLLRPIIVKLFKQIWETGTFSEDWLKPYIVPLHKKGQINNPDNYQGISLISNLCRCFKDIINKRLTNWANDNKVIKEEQAGYVTGQGILPLIIFLFCIRLCSACCPGISCMAAWLIFRKLTMLSIEINYGRCF